MVTNEQIKVILERTENALRVQQNVPLTPGMVCENGTDLCLGAMLVHEALAVLGSPGEAEEFAHRVVHEGGSFIEDTGERIGLDRTMVMMRKEINDGFESASRLEGVLEDLRSLRQAQLNVA